MCLTLRLRIWNEAGFHDNGGLQGSPKQPSLSELSIHRRQVCYSYSICATNIVHIVVGGSAVGKIDSSTTTNDVAVVVVAIAAKALMAGRLSSAAAAATTLSSLQ